MAEMLEEKWPKGVMASIAFFFVLILMLATVAPNKLVDTVMLKERKWGIELLGDSDMDKVLEKTNRYYSALVIDSGAKKVVSDMLMPRGGTVDAFEKNVDWWFRYLESRGEAVQKIIYQMVYRIVLTLYWLPLLIAVLVPAIYAGWMRWNAKRHGFDYSSPFLNNNAAIVLSWGGMLIVLSVLMPLPLPPLVISTFIVIMLPVVLSVLISNLPKRI
ncbi:MULTISPECIES: DUF4400 domain-containing protein [Pseudomonadaceae]|jgi:hypothetical protein|uniref:DUF4400 domain-containing protein n=1 Tax=Pseudomonadaceae TaxID=135621 RepID=UPI0008BDBE4B|nr:MULTISPECIES: DUF4400 domain-containing protein [Pseudomonadaceae]OHC26011.1 MAG: hypothetical protein A3J25_02960 [Pseudomonadales bacterium RIFCSPLOWO2_02_FULL_63_210]EIU2646704.1 DUF4400 domain-containing protein [Pseudomonas aeruginosa]EIU2686581.1 DUF4400 domain-containing protein [Pseudomonas aeruginosa]MBA1264360.1 DUF4400 domain-containing protein [Stutzerimonas stutzeri]MBK3468158.1 DUF4400 domain-containing protein [Pseudomonas sp. MF6776]